MPVVCDQALNARLEASSSAHDNVCDRHQETAVSEAVSVAAMSPAPNPAAAKRCQAAAAARADAVTSSASP